MEAPGIDPGPLPRRLSRQERDLALPGRDEARDLAGPQFEEVPALGDRVIHQVALGHRSDRVVEAALPDLKRTAELVEVRPACLPEVVWRRPVVPTLAAGERVPLEDLGHRV